MNDKVPEKYKALFTNEEWLQHQLVVMGSWIFFAIAGINHILVTILYNKPHIKP